MSERRLALVVTVDRHDNRGLRDLTAPAADAAALADVLGRPELGGFELEFLHNPTSATTYERVDGLLADRHPSDLVLLHFSGHGMKDLDGELYLAATNTNPGRLASTGVEAAWISRMMQRSRAQRVVLLLDCCYGGAFERGVLARADERIDVGDQFRPGRLGESRGRVVITASTAMEYAFENAGVSEGARPGRRSSPARWSKASAPARRTGTRTASWRSTSCTTTCTTGCARRPAIRRRANGSSACAGTCTWRAIRSGGRPPRPCRPSCTS